METSNKRYREKLVQQIKDAGEELIHYYVRLRLIKSGG